MIVKILLTMDYIQLNFRTYVRQWTEIIIFVLLQSCSCHDAMDGTTYHQLLLCCWQHNMPISLIVCSRNLIIWLLV